MTFSKNWLWLATALLVAGALGMQAQTADSGKKVKRITFDREQVSIIYNDGTKEEAVQQAVIVRDATVTGIKGMQQQGQQTERRCYAIDGRTVQSAQKGLKKGVYVVKEGDKVRKIIKK
ncbi:MAG: hypothetical protein J6Y33_07035 [Prevotella sp.]|nr:hypothetical protein [Prevotella sp.]